MQGSKNSGEINKQSNQNGYNANKESKKRHGKFDFGRCKVCKDKATGIHYGIPSCEGCKVIIMKIFQSSKSVVLNNIL